MFRRVYIDTSYGNLQESVQTVRGKQTSEKAEIINFIYIESISDTSTTAI
jgi:hypothetical protein